MNSQPKGKAAAWLKALRLKFYPMSWVTYAIGALAAGGTPEVFASPVFWAGFAFIFFLEVATVFSNEYYDYPSDSANRFAGPFTGGSRVLVDGDLGFGELRLGIGLALLMTLLAALLVLATAAGPATVMAPLMLLLAVLAVGYTVPPLKLCWRTLGELDVGVTDSIGVMLCGYVFFGGHWLDPLPWLLSLPLLLAFLPSITLSGIPDMAADALVGKRTIAVRFGVRGAVLTAQAAALLAALAAAALHLLDWVEGAYGPLILLSLLHAAVLCRQLHLELRDATGARRIDTLMLLSLSFVVWFGALPLFRLL